MITYYSIQSHFLQILITGSEIQYLEKQQENELDNHGLWLFISFLCKCEKLQSVSNNDMFLLF